MIPRTSPFHTFIIHLLEQSLKPLTKDKYSQLGQNTYHPKILIKLLFYGYATGERSARNISSKCETRASFFVPKVKYSSYIRYAGRIAVTGNLRQKFISAKIVLAVKRDHYVPDRSIVPLTWKTGENYFYKCETGYRPKPDTRSISRGSGPPSRYSGI